MDISDINILACIMIFPIFMLLLLISKFLMKLKFKSMEFKVILITNFSSAFIVELVAIGIGILGNSRIWIIPLMLIGFAIVSYSYYYIIKIINSQKKRVDIASMSMSSVAEELSSGSSEISASTEEVSKNAQTVVHNTQALETLLTNIYKIAKEIKSDSDILMKSSHEIENIMRFLISISEQINLLALNASIEAGRAGDYGKGFSVVANKVQKLADESKNAVGSTSSNIEKVVEKIISQVNLIAGITENINLASNTSEDIVRSMESIASSAEEQASAMEEISDTAARLGLEAGSLKKKLFF